MSAEEFWHGDPKLVSAYREAEKIRWENKYVEEWRQGLYVFEALKAAAPAYREFSKGKGTPYPKEPLFAVSKKHIGDENKERAEMEKQKAALKQMVENFNAKFAEKEALSTDKK